MTRLNTKSSLLAWLLLLTLPLLACERSKPTPEGGPAEHGAAGHEHEEGEHEENQHEEGEHEEGEHEEGAEGAHGGEADDHEHGKGDPHAHRPGAGHAEDHGEEAHAGHGHDESPKEGRVALTPQAWKAAKVETQRAQRRALPHVLQLSGELQYPPGSVAHITPRVPGSVVKSLAEIGQQVEVGTPIVEFRSPELGAGLAEYETARRQVATLAGLARKMASLRAERLVREAEVVQAKTELERARAQMLVAEQRLLAAGLSPEDLAANRKRGEIRSSLVLRSPIAGRITALHAATGEYVDAGETLATISSGTELDLWLQVPPNLVSHLQQGSPARILSSAWPGVEFAGTLDHLGTEVDPTSRALKSRVRVQNPEGRLRPGMFVQATIEELPSQDAGTPHAGEELVVVVPTAAVRKDAKGTHVYIVVAPFTVERRDIVVTRTEGALAAVSSGLDDDAEVVTRGGFLVGSTLQRDQIGHGHAH